MRVTNNMIVNNMLLNLNRNLSTMDKLQQQMSTGKKIQYPSDDPIIAGRALKLRTNVAEVEQYQQNIKDGISWMDVTEQAFMNINDILDRARDLCVEGSSDTLETEDQEKIAAELEQLKMQLVQEGNVNYAGRYVFSGYKTDKKLVFDQDNDTEATITERFTKDDVETIQVSFNGELKEVNRIRLAYDELDSVSTSDIIIKNVDDINTTDPTDPNYDPDPYTPDAPAVAYYNKATGELYFNSKDDIPASGIEITYEKKGFKAGDLNPEHYFGTDDQNIQYEVGINNKIDINTLGKDVLTPDLIRDMDELITNIRNAKGDTLAEDQLNRKFSAMIGKLDNHMKQLSREHADLGSRMNRLELTQNRLEADELNFTELMANNEDIDITEVMTKFRSQEMVYQASLMTSARVIQPTLVDFVK